MSGPAIGVLVPDYDGEPGRPEDKPIGRAALRLQREGLDPVFGHRADHGRLSGFRATRGRWVPAVGVPIAAAFDRFPSQSRAAEYAVLRRGLGTVPVANPMSMTLLCQDKLETQRALEAAGLRMPDVEHRPERFADRVAQWGAAYVKPRYGAFGRGVRRVVHGRFDALLSDPDDPILLQRAVPPIAGWTGVCMRVLCQRRIDDTWWIGEPVARRSRRDWVVNRARGAEVASGTDAVPDTIAALRDLAWRVCAAMSALPDGDLLVEVGLDAVIDDRRRPRLIEVNSRPRGRLEALAALDPQRWGEEHVEACARPLRYLAARFASG